MEHLRAERVFLGRQQLTLFVQQQSTTSDINNCHTLLISTPFATTIMAVHFEEPEIDQLKSEEDEDEDEEWLEDGNDPL